MKKITLSEKIKQLIIKTENHFNITDQYKRNGDFIEFGIDYYEMFGQFQCVLNRPIEPVCSETDVKLKLSDSSLYSELHDSIFDCINELNEVLDSLIDAKAITDLLKKDKEIVVNGKKYILVEDD